MAQLKCGHCTARSTVLTASPVMVKDKSRERGQTAVRLDPINDGVQPDVLQQSWAVMACQKSKPQDVRAATWNVSSMVGQSDEVVDVRGYLVLLVEDTSSFGKAVIKELLVFMGLFLRDGLTVLSMSSCM